MPRRASILAAALACACALPAAAASIATSFDCRKAESSAEKAVCASDQLASLDLELARLYRLALDGPHMTTERRRDLKAAQSDWILIRDDCRRSAELDLDTCVGNSYAFRIQELREGYADARANDGGGRSTGPVAFRCEGLGALLSVTVAQVGTPLAVILWGENEIVLPQVSTDGGTTYASAIWDRKPSSFSTLGDTATFSPPGGPDYSCRSEPIG